MVAVAQVTAWEAVICCHRDRRIQVESRGVTCPALAVASIGLVSQRHHASSGGPEGEGPGQGGPPHLAHERID